MGPGLAWSHDSDLVKFCYFGLLGNGDLKRDGLGPEKRARLDIQLLLPSPLSVFLGAEATIPGLTPWPSVFGRIPQIKELPPSKINFVLFF